jgi:GntR family transcriptional regulator, transcriptional repressor for pyruvate dehydrogenase complex
VIVAGAVAPWNGGRAPATDGVAKQIVRLITENGLAAGASLPSEQVLSDMFGVSKRVVREALRALAAQGIVRTSQGKRAIVAETEASAVAIEAYFRFVQRMDRKSVLELYEMREVIEVGTMALAARRASEEDTALARRAVEAMARAGDDVDAYVASDLAFHAAIIDAAHNRFLSGVMTALAAALHVERELGARNRIRSGRRPRAVQEHHAVLEAVEAHDPDRAEEAMIAHMVSGRADVRRHLSGHDEAAGGGSGQPTGRDRGGRRQSTKGIGEVGVR